MNVTPVSRRSVVKSAAALGAAAALGTRAARAATIDMRLFWWGSQERIRRTTADLALYHQQNPDVTLIGELAGSDYWTKIATQMAGRDLADIFQLDHGSVADYSHRGAAVQLDRYIPKPLDLTGFDANMRALGQVDGKTYGIAQGVNTYAIVYDSTVLDTVKLAPPKYEFELGRSRQPRRGDHQIGRQAELLGLVGCERTLLRARPVARAARQVDLQGRWQRAELQRR